MNGTPSGASFSGFCLSGGTTSPPSADPNRVIASGADAGWLPWRSGRGGRSGEIAPVQLPLTAPATVRATVLGAKTRRPVVGGWALVPGEEQAKADGQADIEAKGLPTGSIEISFAADDYGEVTRRVTLHEGRTLDRGEVLLPDDDEQDGDADDPPMAME